jgi:hypothetical protein
MVMVMMKREKKEGAGKALLQLASKQVVRSPANFRRGRDRVISKNGRRPHCLPKSICFKFGLLTFGKTLCLYLGFYGVVVSIPDFESGDGSSNLPRTFLFVLLFYFFHFVLIFFTCLHTV